MCPYFWKYVLTIIFLPVILLGKLLYFLMPAKKSVEKGIDFIADSKVGRATGNAVQIISEQEKVWEVTGKTFKWGFILVAAALCLSTLVSLAMLFLIDTFSLF